VREIVLFILTDAFIYTRFAFDGQERFGNRNKEKGGLGEGEVSEYGRVQG
jgi:hypothetical protein